MAKEQHVQDVLDSTNEKCDDLEMMWWRAAFDPSNLVFEGDNEPLAKEHDNT
jgi:hypothetical protein